MLSTLHCKCDLTWFILSQTSCRWPSHTIQFAKGGRSNNERCTTLCITTKGYVK
uniref:Uncharacterized protein n=1 Tax=Amphimedon queenslandica TaxID=400682 RepID=A0A1X7TE21_AMPQE